MRVPPWAVRREPDSGVRRRAAVTIQGVIPAGPQKAAQHHGASTIRYPPYSLQPPLWELEDCDWLKVLKVREYAPRKQHRITACPGFPDCLTSQRIELLGSMYGKGLWWLLGVHILSSHVA